MTIRDQFQGLPQERQRRVHLALCDQALIVWKRYASENSRFQYTDSVVGMVHEIDLGLPEDALQTVRSGIGVSQVASRYREPIVAMQDDDLEFPESVMYAYYAIYNCFRKYSTLEEIEPWLIVNQALSSQHDDQWHTLITQAILAAT